MDLAALLERLNAEIDKFNLEVDEAVEQGELDERDAPAFKVAPGSATFAMVHADSWPLAFNRAVDCHTTMEQPEEIMRMAKSCQQPTKITKNLCFGCAKSKKIAPVLVRTIDLAHLLARCQGSEVTI